jgi:hypothetical protein
MSYEKIKYGGGLAIRYTRISDTQIVVHLNDRKSGVIQRTEAGFQYIPQGQKKGGEIFSSLTKLKADIEG